MTLQQLKYIVTVAEVGNITESAERLYITQPSLTSAIHTIEEELNVAIFSRSNKGAYKKELLEYGYKVGKISMKEETVEFIKEQ